MNSTAANVIEAHPFFRGMKPEHLNILIEGAVEASFDPGEILFREKEPANQFYLIREGTVALETSEPAHEPVLIQKLHAGDVLGWSWLFPPFVWHFRARALERTEAIILDAGHLLAASERDSEFGYQLMKRVTQILIQRLQITRNELVARDVASLLTI